MKLEISKEWLLKTLELEQLLISLQAGTGDLAVNPEQLIEWEHRAKKFYQKLVMAQTKKYEKLLDQIRNLTNPSWPEDTKEAINDLIVSFRENRDFKTEAHLENGNYSNLCSYCNQWFLGYKRRFQCKSCEDISNEIKSEN